MKSRVSNKGFGLIGILIAAAIMALLVFGVGRYFESATSRQSTSTPTSQYFGPYQYAEESYGIFDTGMNALNKAKELRQTIENQQNQLEPNIR